MIQSHVNRKMETLMQCTIILYTKRTILAKVTASYVPSKEKAEARH